MLGLPMSTFFYSILPLVFLFTSVCLSFINQRPIEERINKGALISQFDSYIKSNAISGSTKIRLENAYHTLNRLTPESPTQEIPANHPQKGSAEAMHAIMHVAFKPRWPVYIAEAVITSDKNQYGW